LNEASIETRAEPLGEAFDLLAAYRPHMGFLFDRNGFGVAGADGILTPGARTLADLADPFRRVRPAIGRGGDVAPFAAGGIAFSSSPTGAASHGLMIAHRAVRRGHAGTWRIDTAVPPDVAADVAADVALARPFERLVPASPHAAFAAVQVREVPSASDYGEAVRRAVERIRAGALRKVVLARTIEVDAGRTLDPRRLAHRLRAVDPDAYTFAVPTANGILVGASPELLISRFGRRVRSNPLAGSAPRSGDPAEDRAAADALLCSAKNREEHAIVVDAVAGVLEPLCEELRWDPAPVLRETPNVWHLSTSFDGLLRDPPLTVLELVAALHPTPAVAGSPTEEALATIAELESFDRGSYAGPVGWVDAGGDGEFAIALRCAELRGDRAILYAGAGIVAESHPASEIDETDRKFRAFLDALRWG
jgi:isochorismate synthase